MAKDKETGEVVAIKKIRSLNEVQGVSLRLFAAISYKLVTCLFCAVATGDYNS